MPPTDSSPIDALRRELRRRRRALPETVRQELGLEICWRIARTPMFHHSRRIAFYLANDGEPDLRPLIELAWRRHKACFVPILDKIIDRRLFFAPLRPDQTMRPNRFGIPEPVTHDHERLRSGQLDLILMPLVGFDEQGHRIGMGGGFYDRTLAYLRGRRHRPRPHLMGVAFDCQRTDAIPARPWDVPLQSIATPDRLMRCPAASRTP